MMERMQKTAAVAVSFLALLALPAVRCALDPPLITEITAPQVGLIGLTVEPTISIGFPGGTIEEGTSVYYQIREGKPGGGLSGTTLLSSGSVPALSDGALITDFTAPIVVEGNRAVYYNVWVSFEEDITEDNASTDSFKMQQYQEQLTLLPVIATLLIAVWTKDVLAALAAGVYFATFLIYEFNVGEAILRMFDSFIVPALGDIEHAYIIVFSCFLSGMVACMLRSGGGYGLAEGMAKFARSPRSGGLVMFTLGLLIFFDDYANVLIVGNSMRPIADKLLISREKLAFLTDATSGPVASISPVSSWIGFELSLITDSLAFLQDQGVDTQCYGDSAFVIFLKTIITRFYPICMLMLQFVLIVSGKEMGPMLNAERRARTGKIWGDNADPGQVEMDPQMEPRLQTPRRWWNGALPIIVVIISVLMSLVFTGLSGCHRDDVPVTVQNVFTYADSYGALLWGSFFGSCCIWFLSWFQRVTVDGRLVTLFTRAAQPLMSWKESIEVWVVGIKNLMSAIIILLLAWSIGSAFVACGTGLYISSAIGDGVDPRFLPVLSFSISAILSFVTGTSWGTMAIMFPLVVPAAHYSAPCDTVIFYGTISSILSGSVFGDHCSPISDTTILSALAARCDLGAHIITQAPYSVLMGVVTILCGSIPLGFNPYPGYVSLLICLVVTIALGLALTVKIEGTDKVDPMWRLWKAAAARLTCCRSKKAEKSVEVGAGEEDTEKPVLKEAAYVESSYTEEEKSMAF